MTGPLKNFAYSRCALVAGNYPDEAKPLAESLSKRLRAGGIVVESIQKNWEDLRMVCQFQGQTFWLDVTTYVEVQPPEFSLEIKPACRKYLWWFRRSRLRSLIEKVDEILYSDAVFSEIRWYRSQDLRKGIPGSDHPFM
jgi:hypothetical protein